MELSWPPEGISCGTCLAAHIEAGRAAAPTESNVAGLATLNMLTGSFNLVAGNQPSPGG
ncbi:hypothetical protein [Actinomadura sp. 7K534]|uniref:hypothetical protein n=1 Tax=Actinomadura sp. 7K534 TaxID=2530366 RepID=UPI001404D451|nr:hypothetical protein [Actinomadura sp. 7K534]